MTVTPFEHSAAGPSASHPRIHIESTAEEALGALDSYVATKTATLGLDRALLELNRLGASQINGCHLCLDMHARHARARAVNERRLDVLPARREAPWYTDRERAALAWTEAVTPCDQPSRGQPERVR